MLIGRCLPLFLAAFFCCLSVLSQDAGDWEWDVDDPSFLTNDVEVYGGQDGRAVIQRSTPQAGTFQYDPLPLRFAEMNKYDQIAMEPYRDKYDSMTIGEKAEVYGQQFEFMKNRKPNFDPAVTELRDAYQDSKSAPTAYEAKQHLYKPAVEKKRRPKRKPPPQQSNEPPHSANLLEALPGPWERVPEPEAEPEPEFEEFDEEPEPVPAGPDYPRDDLRMENLRRGWNAVDVIRGTRKR